MDQNNLGSEWLETHLEKNCGKCVEAMNKHYGIIAEVKRFNMENEPGRVEDTETLIGPVKPAHNYDLSTVEAFLAIAIKDQMSLPEDCSCKKTCQCVTKKNRRINLFNTRKFSCEALVTEENGIKDYSKLIDHIEFIQELLRDLRTIDSAAKLVKINMMNHATAAERERIREKDKEYEPKYKEREAKEATVKLTPEEKKIREFVKIGLSREQAEKIIFAR